MRPNLKITFTEMLFAHQQYRLPYRQPIRRGLQLRDQGSYRDQPTRFEWGYDPDALKQQDRWQKFSTRELKSLKQALAIADGESMLDDIAGDVLHQIEEAIQWRTTE